MKPYEQQALEDAQAHRFDPYHLRPLASLNRRHLIALPGLDEADAGKSGSELLSKDALPKGVTRLGRMWTLVRIRLIQIGPQWMYRCYKAVESRVKGRGARK